MFYDKWKGTNNDFLQVHLIPHSVLVCSNTSHSFVAGADLFYMQYSLVHQVRWQTGTNALNDLLPSTTQALLPDRATAAFLLLTQALRYTGLPHCVIPPQEGAAAMGSGHLYLYLPHRRSMECAWGKECYISTRTGVRVWLPWSYCRPNELKAGVQAALPDSRGLNSSFL